MKEQETQSKRDPRSRATVAIDSSEGISTASSTNSHAVKFIAVRDSRNRRVPGLYFFALTAAEVLVAQSLKSQFRFIFVNTVTGAHIELMLSEVFARDRGIYPTWSISF
jgi:hypothetical protein